MIRSNLDIRSESDCLALISEMKTEYNKIFKKMVEKYDELVAIKESFPMTILGDTDFEELLLVASNAKYKAIVLARELNSLYSQVNNEYLYVVANLKLYAVEEALSEKFDKILESHREAYLNSKKELLELKNFIDKIYQRADSSEKMIRLFDSDEVNFRRIAEKKRTFT